MSAPDNGLTAPAGSFAERMTELMHERGRSFRALAAAAAADPGYLNHIAKGRRPPPEAAVAAALDTALHAGGELKALAEAERRAAQPPRPAGAARVLGDDDAAQARDTTMHLVALDIAHGSDGLTPLAVRSFRAAADQLAVVGGTADVRSAVADLGAAAAWIASDAVERDLSRAIALEALAMADMAGDQRMRQFLLSHLSMVSEHGGRYADALAYADRMLAEQPASPRVRAMFQLRRARALSGLGAHADALTAWDHATRVLTDTPPVDDGLTYWIHDSEMAIHKAVILTRGQSREAVDWARRGVECLPHEQGRDQVLFRAMLLHDAVAAHAWREVPEIAEDLTRHATAARSARVPEQLEATARLLDRHRTPVAVRAAVLAARDAFRR